MSSMWLKIKIWTKVVIFALVAVYLLIFVLKNNDRTVQFWYWYNRAPEASVLLLVTLSFLFGVVVAVLVRMMFKTINQVREMRNRSRTERLEREVADMKTKAAMLQTRGANGGGETLHS
ncbi:MAG TPA: LapA family protein [Tepidisphaeraceae bacterium]|nr:LapA family protein [Tepidisphaeraceae bacterium]